MADQSDRINGNERQEAGASTIPGCCGAGFFEIRVQGQLSAAWSEWLEGLEVQCLEDGEMVLVGPILDQAALLGVLNKLNRLNLALLSVNKLNRND